MAGCGGKAATTPEFDRLRELVNNSIARIKKIPTFVLAPVSADAPASQPQPTLLSNVVLFNHLARGDLTVFQATLPVLQAAYEKGNISDTEYFRYFAAFEKADEDLLPQLDAWVAREPESYSARVSRAVLRAQIGWLERGGNIVSQVPKRKWRALEKWHRLAAEDLFVSLALSTRPTPSIVKLLEITRSFNFLKQQDQTLFEEGERLDARSRYLFSEYSHHQYGEWGGKAGGADTLLARAKKNRVDPDVVDSMERHLYYLYHGKETNWNPNAAVAMAVRYSEQKPTVDAWLWRAEVQIDHGHFGDAEQSLNHVLTMAPENETALKRRAYARELQGNLAGALEDFQRASQLGSDYAQDRLIDAYLRPRLGLQKSLDAAWAVCEESAAMLNRAGQYCVGAMYFDGLAGYRNDKAEAFKWFRKAARNGEPTSQHNVGWMLIIGNGVKKDRVEGVYWLRQAARQNFEYAIAKLRELGEPVEDFEDEGIIALIRRLLHLE